MGRGSKRLRAARLGKYNTTLAYKTALDSVKKKVVFNSDFQYDTLVISLLKLDQLESFRKTLDSIVTEEKNTARAHYLFQEEDDYSKIAILCGRIRDKRFISPLVAALKKPKNFSEDVVLEALASLGAEPYYSRYLKSRKRPLSEVKKKQPPFSLNDLVYVLRNQESFLELSKYLLSDAPCILISDMPIEKAIKSFTVAYILIRDNIANEDLQKLIKDKDPCGNPEIRMLMYSWMQKNYGKYKIKRI